MRYSWIIIALFSAFFTSLRHIHIKNKCSGHSSEIVIFVTRLAGVVALFPFALAKGFTIIQLSTFAFVTALTVVITAFATIIQIALLQQKDISRSIPYLSFIPIFMVPWSVALLGEMPSDIALLGIVITCLGAYIINVGEHTGILGPLKSIVSNKASLLMLVVAFCLAFNTVCDKIAITAASAFTYIYIWSVSSTVVMGLISLTRNSVHSIKIALTDKHVVVQALYWVSGYSCQIFAIGAAVGIQSGTTYVRALTLLNVLFTVIFGGALFREENLIRKSLATLMMVGGSVLIIISAGSFH
ncbi:MAG: EamA family transporter [Candidatus Latescibacteria bacterium]|nr:EamA family transporter [Candidatus Latescibacterota bacterium]